MSSSPSAPLAPPERDPALPRVLPAATAGTAAAAYLAVAGWTVRQRLHECGAVVLRGFEVDLARVVRALSGSAAGTVVRGQVPDPQPRYVEVLPHHVGAEADTWPATLLLHYVHAPEAGGATTLVDTRRVLRSIDPDVREEFARRGWLGAGRRHRAVHLHPETGEAVWFNGVLTSPYFGDGEPVPGDVLAHLRDGYRAASRRFVPRRNDVLLVDNMLVAHGREPYTGRRVVAAAETVR
ncbi:TauD/TfdA family dioxygenase [Actinophytocola xanthii]|uniref:TauD/TfdA-like domain-containing protein n=1 Tax=Actinophytocola xanthii TaxID=1912961 RepID=A0A1Q8CMF9_9PSEU|nr:TauD/TfdA family dioxygenase [Actinophytocola xanthii]OLF15553.1 hypothetical protein BU204_21780 [Actinophytocola xanthii]